MMAYVEIGMNFVFDVEASQWPEGLRIIAEISEVDIRR